MARKNAGKFVRGHYLFRTLFRERSSMKTVSFDETPSIFSRQMETIQFIFFAPRAVLKTGEYHL